MSEQSDRETAAGRLARIRAAAIQADSQPHLLAAARWLRRRLPGDDRFGDPLSTAGDRTPEVLARQVATLQAERPSVAHELGLGALQLWQGLSEGVGRGRGEGEVALLFTDVVGFSSWALEVGDEAAVDLLRAVGEVIDSSVSAHGGAVVKHLGDGAMAVFDGAGDAVEAALDARDELASEVEVAGHRPRLRSGVHQGRPRKLGRDYLGVDVNVAARIVDQAKPQQVLVSEAACQALGEPFEIGKAKKLKAPGAPKELRVSEVERRR